MESKSFLSLVRKSTVGRGDAERKEILYFQMFFAFFPKLNFITRDM